MAKQTVAGTEQGQRQLNGPQTTGRSYRNLSEPQYGMVLDADQRAPMRDGISLLADVIRPAATHCARSTSRLAAPAGRGILWIGWNPWRRASE